MSTFRFVNISPMLKSLLAITSPIRFQNSEVMQRYLRDLAIHREQADSRGRNLEQFIDDQDFLFEWREPQDHPAAATEPRDESASRTPNDAEAAAADTPTIPLVVIDSVAHPRLGRTGWLLSSSVIRRLNEQMATSRSERTESPQAHEEESGLGGAC